MKTKTKIPRKSFKQKSKKQIKNIIETLRCLKEEIKEKYKAEIIGIFGSYARGEQKKKSDLDVLVKFYKKATLFEFVGLAFFLEEKLGIKKVDVVPYDTVREELKEYIFKETIYI
jgi:predicted nucleotidyltransferase